MLQSHLIYRPHITVKQSPAEKIQQPAEYFQQPADEIKKAQNSKS
jgi:hypothetical protein